ncbi:MAG: hypothetical protein HeimC3_39430 [Candidatus Heimdallarchaeota archaeon LC_3]|nr:MAG: hypothetical protein HeimC3_39430 [Candidatus Heimdallarchaeota archaeon LC_3]
MQIKKKIDGRQLIIDWSVWSSKLIIEYDNETIHETWEITFWVTVAGLFTLLIGIFFGIYIGMLYF